MNNFTRRAAIAAALITSSAALSSLHAQQFDSRWQAWLGCWRPNSTVTMIAADSTDATPANTLVCIVPGATATSVEIVNFNGGRIASRGIVEPNGQPVEKTVDDCRGWERARWSSDNKRVMLQSEFTCANNVKRKETGVLAMTPSADWVQIQNLDVSGNSALYVGHLHHSGIAIEGIANGALIERPALDEQGRRVPVSRNGCVGDESAVQSSDGRTATVVANFDCNGLKRLANAVFQRDANGQWVRTDKQLVPFTTITARLAVASYVTVDAITEMAKFVDIATVEAWLTDRDQSFNLNGRDLVRLADAGIPSRVIDVLVALDHPQQFALRSAQQRPMQNSDPDYLRVNSNRGVYGYGGGYLDEWDYAWDPYRFNYRYGYGYGFNRGYNGFDNGLYGLGYPYGRRPIMVLPREEVKVRAKAVYGQGYTRDRGAERARGEPATFSPPSKAPTTRETGTRSTGSTGSSSGGSTGRTAKARGGN